MEEQVVETRNEEPEEEAHMAGISYEEDGELLMFFIEKLEEIEKADEESMPLRDRLPKLKMPAKIQRSANSIL